MLKAIIVDDEERSVDNLELIILQYCPEVSIAGKAYSGKEGIQVILDNQPDIVFLDVEMPHMDGFEMLESMKDRNFDVVFVTAYNHYAIKAFKVNAVDYIMKPVNIQELINAVKKIAGERNEKPVDPGKYSSLLENIRKNKSNRFVVSTNEGLEYIPIHDIIYFQADRSYTNIILVSNRKSVLSKPLTNIEQSLTHHPNFYRVHKAALVNIEYVKRINRSQGYVEMINGNKVPLARRKTDDFIRIMEDFIHE